MPRSVANEGSAGGGTASLSVLVFDDEALIAYDLGGSVEDCGLELAGIAVTFEEAEAIRAKAKPDIALLDIDIEGTPVWDFARKLKAGGTTIIFLSANVRHAELAEEFGDSERLEKPVPTAAICEMLKKVAARL